MGMDQRSQYLEKHITDLLIVLSQIVRVDLHQEGPVCSWRHLALVLACESCTREAQNQ